MMTTIRELLSDRTAPVRSSAVLAIVQMGSRESKDILRRRFSHEKDPAVKRAIALGLGKLADTGSLDLLTAALARPALGPAVTRRRD